MTYEEAKVLAKDKGAIADALFIVSSWLHREGGTDQAGVAAQFDRGEWSIVDDVVVMDDRTNSCRFVPDEFYAAAVSPFKSRA